jgi:hypothetical protein
MENDVIHDTSKADITGHPLGFKIWKWETESVWHWKSYYIGKEGKVLYFESQNQDFQTFTNGSPDIIQISFKNGVLYYAFTRIYTEIWFGDFF